MPEVPPYYRYDALTHTVTMTRSQFYFMVATLVILAVVGTIAFLSKGLYFEAMTIALLFGAALWGLRERTRN